MALTGKNISLPIYHNVDGVRTPFHNLVLHKFTVDSVVMSLGDKITGDVYYINSDLECSMQEYVVFNDIEYTLVNPPTLVREGLVKDNSDLNGMSKYSFEFYHPMYILGNLPFTDVAVSYDELRYKSQDKTFSWIGRPSDFVAKLNKNLENTEWVVVLSDRFPQDKEDELSEVLSFDNNTIADVLKTGYETWDVPFVIDKLEQGQYYHTDANNHNVDYYTQGKRFVVVFGLPSNEIYNSETDQQQNIPFVFQFGQGVGLKNNSRTPRNNKIVTRIAGYGSENNIPYGYPQIRWYGNQDWDYTINNTSGMQEITVNGETITAMSYPIYKGIVGGEWVKLIKHPFTRNHLMPTIYADGVFNKVSQFTLDENENVIDNPNYNPDLEIKDYYDAAEGEQGYDYENLINPVAPSYEIHEFDDIKPELGEAHILGATPINADLTDSDDWDDTMDDNGNYLQSYFKITLPQLTFDIYACAAITQEMEINMRGGACIGCTFTVQVDWEDYKRNFYDSDMNFAPHGAQRDYTRYPDSSQESITVIVQKDINTFGTLMPNIYQNPHAGDAFVVLGISLPLSYITSAQERLDDAMKSYMLENNVYYFDYPLKFDEYFLANRTNILNQIRPNSIIRFDFNNEPLELFVKQLTIKFNESVLPQYDITLTDNVEIVLNQIGQVADDVEHLSSLIALLRQQYGKNVIVELAKKLSKVDDDTASGLIAFAQGWETLGFFSNNFLGYGAKVNQRGVGEFEEINIRGALRAAELVFNQIRAEGGEKIESIGYGEILTVDEENMTATLKLDGNEWATIDVDDICRGLYNTIGKGYDNSDVVETEDDNGFRTKKGFFASYFKIEEIITNTKGECEFRYSLQPETTEHPCPLMKFAVYGNFNRYEQESKKSRQSSIYTTAVGIAPRMLYLAGVNDWKIRPYNIKVALGNIEGIEVYELLDGVPSSKILHGNAGIYVENNIYLGGILNQFTSADWDTLRDELGQGIHAQLIVGSDNIVVDALGNVIGGLVVEDTDGTTVTRQYKLHTGVIVYDSAKERYLTIGESGNLQDGEFAMYVSANGCTVTQDGADIYVTAIDNTANGNVLTDEQLETMRNTEGFAVDFVIVTASGWRTQMSYPVKITHLDQAFITFDLTNEMDSMAYSSQLRKYLGLPITSNLKAYVNGIEVNDFVSVSMASNAFTGTKTTSNAIQAAVGYFGDTTTSKLQARLTLDGLFTITQGEHNVQDLDDTKYWFDLSCVVKYAGVQYTSPIKRLTVQETTDATLYKLLLSANAVSKNEDIYVPNTIDVKVQVIDSVGTHVYTAAEMNASGNIKVRYVNGIYGESAVINTMPDFSDVPTCLTVVLRDETDANNPVVLDLESVPMTAVGRNGAGQPWVKVNYDSFTIDCDSDGYILGSSNVPIIVSAELYWGDQICDLQSANCQIYLKGETPSGASNVFSNHADKTFTFIAGSAFESTDIIISLTGLDTDNEPHTATKTIPIIANCKGEKGDDGDSGAAVRFRGNYSQDVDSETGYIWNSYFRDCVKQGSSYYLVKVQSNGSEPLGTPNGSSNANWEDIGGMNFVATELLLTENAIIDLLYSNIIKMRDSNGNLTATINEDQNGSYCIYYKGGSNKRMEFSFDGFIYYYNDDATNSVAWKLGHGGDIHKGSSDDWQLFPLHKLTSEELSNLSKNSRFNLTDYWRFVAGSVGQYSQYNGGLYVDIPNDRNPSNGIFIDEGYYTPNYFPFDDVETMDTPSVPAITLYTVANVDGNVMITNTTIFKQGDTLE